MLLESFKKLKSNSFNDEDINQLAEYCISVAFRYLKSKKKKKYFNLGEEGLSLEDMAVDAVVPLFVKAGNGKLGLVNSLENWVGEIESESDADFFLNRVVWNRAEQAIAISLKERDPFFAKISDTINTCVRNNEFRKLTFLGTFYIVRQNIKELEANLIPSSEFNLIPLRFFAKKQVKLLNDLLDYISKDGKWFPAIPFNLLIKRIKELHSKNFVGTSEAEMNITEELNIAEILSETKTELSNNIRIKYLEKGKLSEYECGAIARAFDNIIVDMKNGGMSEGLFGYLKTEMKELSNEEFYKNYHGIMNYLLKDFKKDVTEKLNVISIF